MEQPDSAAPANIILAETSDVASLLGRNCRARRARFKMSQGELSLRTGISASRLSLIENGRANPTLEIMDAIARALQCSVADLLSHPRSEEHTSELQSLMRISYAVFCLKQKKHKQKT